MQKRKTLLISTALLLCIAALVVPVYASYANSIMYTKFNLLDWTNYQLDQEYSYFTADIKNNLIYNVTGTWAKVAFTNGTGDNPIGINVIFSDDDSTVKVYYIDGTTETEIASGNFTDPSSASSGNVSTTRVVFSGGKVSVYTNYGTRNSAKILDGFSFPDTMTYLRVKGSDLHTVQDGYMQVNVNVGTAGASGNTTSIVMEFIPIIVVFAMMGMVLGLLKKFGKI